jgi:hypothetical protein
MSEQEGRRRTKARPADMLAYPRDMRPCFRWKSWMIGGICPVIDDMRIQLGVRNKAMAGGLLSRGLGAKWNRFSHLTDRAVCNPEQGCAGPAPLERVVIFLEGVGDEVGQGFGAKVDAVVVTVRSEMFTAGAHGSPAASEELAGPAGRGFERHRGGMGTIRERSDPSKKRTRGSRAEIVQKRSLIQEKSMVCCNEISCGLAGDGKGAAFG